MNKKTEIVVCALLIFGMLSMATIGTLSYFNDTETSSGNVLTAGTLDLTVDGFNDPDVRTISIPNMEPGDTIHQYWVLKNVGTINGKVSISFANIVNNENGRTEPEISNGDTTDAVGELGGILYVLMKWRQPVGSGTWHEIMMVMYGHTKLNNLAGPYGLGENGGDPIPILSQNGEVEIELRLWWDGRYSTPADNVAQTDSVTFDVVFRLDQA